MPRSPFVEGSHTRTHTTMGREGGREGQDFLSCVNPPPLHRAKEKFCVSCLKKHPFVRRKLTGSSRTAMDFLYSHLVALMKQL